MDTLRLAGTVPESIVDGPGIRYTVFTQGCPHRCPACHNPQTHDFDGGTVVPVANLLADITKRFTKAVTLSGGEPFCQPQPLAQLATALRAQGFDVMAYSGYTFAQLQAMPDPAVRELLSQLSLLVDGRFIPEQRDISLRFRGSTNQRVLDVPASLTAGAAVWAEQYR